MAGHTVAASTGLVNAVGTGTRVPDVANFKKSYGKLHVNLDLRLNLRRRAAVPMARRCRW